MKQIIIKSARLRTLAVMLLTMGTVSASARYYMDVVQNEDIVFSVKDYCEYYSVQEGSAANYEYVDLGLSVKWATFNVGATKPEEYGDYFAWGETELKTVYGWSTYKWCKGSENAISKYCNKSEYGNNGFTDTKTTLDPEDDVAHVQWGGNWRMPTGAEQDELRKNCTWTWYSSDNTEFDGIAGYKVTSNIEGYTDRFIFLPAAGCRNDTSLYSVGSGGIYWSSSLSTVRPGRACDLEFDSDRVIGGIIGLRVLGYSVRPVCL